MNKKISLVLLLFVQACFCMEEGRVFPSYSEDSEEGRVFLLPSYSEEGRVFPSYLGEIEGGHVILAKELAEMRDGKSEIPSATDERTPLIFIKTSEGSPFQKKVVKLMDKIAVGACGVLVLSFAGFVGYTLVRLLVKGSG